MASGSAGPELVKAGVPIAEGNVHGSHTALREAVRRTTLLGVILALGACQPEGQEPVPPPPAGEATVVADPPMQADSPRTISRGPLPSLPPLRVDSLELDLEEDGEPERVELYVAAERDTDGEILWDDGQRWALIVRAGSEGFVLYDDRVQLGQLGFWAVQFANGEAPGIAVLLDAGAGVVLETLVYEPERDTFTSTGRAAISGNVVARPRSY